MYPDVENMIVVPIMKTLEIIMSIQVCLTSWMNINYKENSGKKRLFLQIQSINIMYPNMVNMIVVPNNKKKVEIITSIQVCLISQMNFDYKENGGKKSFSTKSKASIPRISMGNT